MTKSFLKKNQLITHEKSLPFAHFVGPGSYAPHGPDDMFCGLGKDGQYVYLIPSQNLVLVRM
jgi:hypothetical protein